MSNININVSISLDKTVLATLVGLLGGSMGDEKAGFDSRSGYYS